VTVGFTSSQIVIFLVVLARVSGLILSAPVLGDPQVPRPVKAGLAIILSLVLVGAPSVARAHVPVDVGSFALLIVAQLVIGVVLGFIARTLFFAMQVAGQIASLQTGLSTAAVLNPLTRQPDQIVTQFYTIVAVLTFLAVQGDQWLVASLARSFDLAPLTASALSPSFLNAALNAAIGVTAIGLQISLPLAASIFAANLILGVVSRALPQLNVFVLSMPLDLLLGLVALIGGLAAMIVVIGRIDAGLPRMMLGSFGQ